MEQEINNIYTEYQNKVTRTICHVLKFLYLAIPLTWLGSVFGLFVTNVHFAVVPLGLIMFLPALLLKLGARETIIRYVALFFCCMMMGVMLMLNAKVDVTLMLPTVLAVLYFDKKFTLKIAAMNFLVIAISLRISSLAMETHIKAGITHIKAGMFDSYTHAYISFAITYLLEFIVVTTVLYFIAGFAKRIMENFIVANNEAKQKEKILLNAYNYSEEMNKVLTKIIKSPEYSTGDLKKVADFITQAGSDILKVTRFEILIMKEDGKNMSYLSCYDTVSDKYIEKRPDFNLLMHADYEKLLLTERLLTTNNTSMLKTLLNSRDYYNNLALSSIAAPIRQHNRLLGVVIVEQDLSEIYISRRIWTVEEHSFVATVADLIAIVFANYEIYDLTFRTEMRLNNLPGMVYQCRNNPPHYTCTFVSEGCLELIGWTPEELVGNNEFTYNDMVHPEDRDNFEKIHLETLCVGLPLDINYRIITKNGTVKWIWERSRVIEFFNDGTPKLIEGFYTDITEKVRLEEAERKLAMEKELSEQANNAKTKFLATMSHEIRSPMNAIIGITQLQLQKNNLPREYASDLNKIYEAGTHLLRIINDILDMSKIESGKFEINNIEYDVPSLINDVVQLNIAYIGSKSIGFFLDVVENLPSRFIGDELRLKQILNNILSNAIKYTAEGFVKLSVSHSLRDDGDIMLRFVVKDTGIGMKKEDKERLFSEYLRFNTDASRTTEGTGLGLSITKKLVDMMDGNITVQSEFGKGSVFTVEVKQKPVDCEPIGAELADKLRNFIFAGERQTSKLQITRFPMPYGKVLVVDDMETNLYVAEGLLASYNLSIETANSGSAALTKIENGNSYDVIFMDHMMPKMDGIETTKLLREAGYSAPIVALTANAMAGNAEMFRENGFDGFVPKPIDLRDLNTVLNKFVRDRHPEEAKKYTDAIIISADVSAPADGKFVSLFCRDAKNSIITMLDAMENGDMKLFTTNAHGLKSMLALLGEIDKSAIAAKLEESGNNNDMNFISNNLGSFIDSIEALIASLTPNLIDEKTNTELVEDTEFLREQLLKIKNACEEYNDATVYAILDSLKEKQWKASTIAALDEIYDMVYLSSDFEGAASYLSAYCS